MQLGHFQKVFNNILFKIVFYDDDHNVVLTLDKNGGFSRFQLDDDLYEQVISLLFTYFYYISLIRMKGKNI